MKVLGIVGSPKREGHTAKLVEAVLAGAIEAGHEADIYHLSDLEIGPIQARDGTLVYPDDDMARLYPHLESMDALVLGTPVYYDHVSSRQSSSSTASTTTARPTGRSTGGASRTASRRSH